MQEHIEYLYRRFLRCPEVTTDSRRITPGCLFFGLKGEKVDGSTFGNSALDKGAGVAVVRHGACKTAEGILFVDDPLETLQDLARYHRDQLRIPVLAITGSNGKTTTKELVTRVLSSQYAVKATQGNLNNHIGVPLTVLSITASDQIAIVEMGANHIGEIAMLCKIASPTHGIITNIGKAHLEGFGGIEGVKQAKAELYQSLSKSDGVAFVNKDEPHLLELSRNVMRKVLYGFGSTPAFTVDDYTFVKETSTEFSAVHFADAHGAWKASSLMFGLFNLSNIATAIATGIYFNVEGSAISSAIASYVPDNNRAQFLSIGSNVFIMDAYNANPTSMHSAINSFIGIEHPRKFMVLGSMMELGEYSAAEHLRVAEYVSTIAGITPIFIGELFKEAAMRFGMQWYRDVEMLQQDFSQASIQDAMILVKGSRAMQLENLLRGFQ